jgi:hypothetical protein
MFYEEKLFDGVLMCRSTPTGEWRPATTPYASAVNALMLLTHDQRLEAFGFFCSHCGIDDPKCQCWNDE